MTPLLLPLSFCLLLSCGFRQKLDLHYPRLVCVCLSFLFRGTEAWFETATQVRTVNLIKIRQGERGGLFWTSHNTKHKVVVSIQATQAVIGGRPKVTSYDTRRNQLHYSNPVKHEYGVGLHDFFAIGSRITNLFQFTAANESNEEFFSSYKSE